MTGSGELGELRRWRSTGGRAASLLHELLERSAHLHRALDVLRRRDRGGGQLVSRRRGHRPGRCCTCCEGATR